jgi:hypothetical protein
MDIRNIARELGFFLLFLAVALCLTPLLMDALRLTSEGSVTNKLEELFMIQIGFIVCLATIGILYLIRFLATMAIRWSGGQAAGGETP